MSNHNYLQDLCLLSDDCLLPDLDNDTALISPSVSTSKCTSGLSFNTLEQMILLDHDFQAKGESNEVAYSPLTHPGTDANKRKHIGAFHAFSHSSPPRSSRHSIQLLDNLIDLEGPIYEAASTKPLKFFTNVNHSNLPHLQQYSLLTKTSTWVSTTSPLQDITNVIKHPLTHPKDHIKPASLPHSLVDFEDFTSHCSPIALPQKEILRANGNDPQNDHSLSCLRGSSRFHNETHLPSQLTSLASSLQTKTNTSRSPGSSYLDPEQLMQLLPDHLQAVHPKPSPFPVEQSSSPSLQQPSVLLTQHSPSNLIPPEPSTHDTVKMASLPTALPQHTATDLIADLKRTRLTSDVEAIADTEEDPAEQEDEDDDLEEMRPAPRSQKMSERKRQRNAIIDQHIQQKIDGPTSTIHQVHPDDEANQSTRWLVDQAENREIISTPRDYQVELFERAKERNTIAVLDTGSGKTLIAVLLLRHIFAQELEDRALGKAKRISLFLVDSVTLVFQQHAVLKANLGQPMDMFCGDMGTKMWDRKRWEKNFSDNMVVVCTAEVLRHCLHHSHITMDKINILIFDEAHHAKKDHPYARIIKDFYTEAHRREGSPKIFGMTASPVDARTDPKKAAEDLEKILHCQIATAADTSLLQHAATSKQEHMARYAALGPRIETPLYTQMKALFKSKSVLRKPLAYAYDASRILGSWCSDQMWRFCLGEEQEVKKLIAKTQVAALESRQGEGAVDMLKLDIDEASGIIRAHTFEEPDFTPGQPSTNLSSKVHLLVSYLRERFERPTEDKCIVFVKQRYTARLLSELLSQPSIRTPYLFVGNLVGTSHGESGDLNYSYRTQVLTMMKFRQGKLNCLIATSVAEEGLDVPDCNLIIRFDLYENLIQYIQSRGRARHANSRYIHMCEAGNREHDTMIREVRLNEHVLRTFCNTLPDDRKLTGNDFNMDRMLAKERAQNRTFEHPVTKAMLNYKMSLSVLANFMDSIPHEQNKKMQPTYVVTCQNKMFIGEVILDEQAPIRGAVGRPATTKQVAKCSAAFETCLLLIKGKYLSEWLLPTYTKQLPAMRNALLAVSSKKREEYDMKNKPDLWAPSGDINVLFLTKLAIADPEALGRPSQPLVLLTRSPLPTLPSFNLHFDPKKNSAVHLTSWSAPLNISAHTLEQINLFTLCIFHDVFSKEYESNPAKMPYFLAPLNHLALSPEADILEIIAWDVLTEFYGRQKDMQAKGWELRTWAIEPDEFFHDKYIIDPFDGSRKLWCKGIAPQYKPLDPVPPNTAPVSGTKKNKDNILEYSCSLWPKAREKRILDENQRVFEAEYIPLRRNLLDAFDTSATAPKKCFVTLETLKVSVLPTPVVAMAYLFPAIIHRIEAYLIALEACDLLNLKIRPDLALEAVTKDSDNSGEHDDEKINFQRGMGNNYERLEFLGDCFLKMATSISLYGLHPDNDEFKYHVDRMIMICNKNLCDNAVKMKLYKYIRSQSFNRRVWYPDGLVLKKGKASPAPNSHKLGDKSIADVCEALIGAALLSSDNMDNAVRAVTKLVCSVNHKVESWSDYYKLYEKPAFQTKRSTEMQKDLARQIEQRDNYHFKWPRLLRSAFVHPSYPYSYEQIPSYQRLEFLGDALLDMVCINFLFHQYPRKDPQWLTEHKMAMVSNAFLGCLCVELEFHSHLLIFNSTFSKQIEDYITEIQEAKLQAQTEAVHSGKSKDQYSPDYWISVRPPPKCLPDIVEAYVGALFVDSEYDYSQVERFFDRQIKRFFTDMSIYDSYANKHPTTFLTNFLSVNMGCMDWSVEAREVPAVDGSKPKILAMVVLHDKVIVDGTAESGRYAKVNAAKKALELLKGLPLPEFRDTYGCDCRPPVEGEDVGIDDVDLHGTAI
ncbi:hypothetical protein BJ875DRAFT_159968 [Amylocarpus encephaloides]|uniref:Dicer-like protein 1 n=1 Tax=Amylocarpus encephaloides TaxID=45428 RepID=A0A9P8C8E6_9HELO|nr:hypothetical protein BJ875DRAFT_159968 [Amylocarpus encephaloides]